MYLLFASTTHDLRAGFSLLVGGSCAGHRAFGVGLLTVYGFMLSAAMTVIVSSEDNGTVVINAVAVIFIADLVSAATYSTIPVHICTVVFHECALSHQHRSASLSTSIWLYLVYNTTMVRYFDPGFAGFLADFP